MKNTQPKVSVIIAAYQSGGYIKRCLRSLQNQRFKDFETIVVNSSQESETAEAVSAFPGICFHQHSERLLPHAARNQGAAMAKGGLLVFTDADCKADPGWLEALVRCHEQGYVYICGSIETESPRWVSKAIHLLKYSPYLYRRRAGAIRIAATGNMSVTRQAWQTVGPFDGTVFSGDALLSWKAKRAGIDPWFEPLAIVYDQDEEYRKNFLPERYRRGMEYGRLRAGFGRWNKMTLAVRTLIMPLALLSALLTMASNCQKAGRLADFVWTLPFLTVAQAAWCIGEARAFMQLLLTTRRHAQNRPE